jgi:succinate-acetate transporter protein
MTGGSTDRNDLPVAARVVLRPLANPLPLGFLALGAANLLLSGVQLGWLETTDAVMVPVILLAFVAPLLLIASILGFLARDPVAGTGMGVLAGAWAAIGIVMFRGHPGATSRGLGLLLLVAAAGLLIAAAGAIGTKLVPAAVLSLTALRFSFGGIHQLSGNSFWKTSAGVLGLFVLAAALYAATAFMLEETNHTTRLPLGRRQAGRRAHRSAPRPARKHRRRSRSPRTTVTERSTSGLGGRGRMP